MAEIWWPKNYCERLPIRCTAPFDGPPHYPLVPRIALADMAPRRMGPRRAKFWRLARDRSMEQWAEVGFWFVVHEFTTPYQPGRITLDARATQDGTRGQADFAATEPYDEPPQYGLQDPLPGVAWAHVSTTHFEQSWQAKNLGMLVKVMAHEIGHCLGFGHDDNPKALMNTYATGSITYEEVLAGRDFWFPSG